MKRSLTDRLRAGGRRTHTESKVETKIENIAGEKFSWIDLENPDRRDVETLAAKYQFNELNIEDCMTKFELPKLDSYDNHFFVILHFPPLIAKKRMQRYSQLSIFMGKDFLITIHQGDLKPLTELVEICKGDIDPHRKQRLLGNSSGVLLHEIIDILVDDLLHTSRRIIANLDDIEDRVFDETKSAARSISILRREINMVRRIVNPLKRFVLEIGEQVKRFPGSGKEELELYFDDVIDHINKVIESLEESRETMDIYKDTDFMLSTEKTNKVLAALTIIFALAIPATIIGTFYGMNVNLPGGITDDGSGVYNNMIPEELGTIYQPFILIIIASAIPAILMIIYFKKLGWIGR